MLSSLRSGIATESDRSETAVDHGQVDGRRKTSSLENLHDFDGTVYIPVAEHLGEVPGRRPRTTELELENKRLQNDLFQTQNDLIKVKSKLFKCNLGRMSDELIQTNSQKADRLSSNPGHNDITITNSTFFDQKKEKLCVASFHIDDDYICNGFSLKHEYLSDPMAMSFRQEWPRGSGHHVSRKVPTVILLNGDKTFHSFGYVAEDNYNELVLHDERENYHYFKRFTRRLHGKKIYRDIEVEDDLGRPMKAIIVFTEMIRYLKQDMFTFLNKQLGLDYKDIHWVLTVPAIWSNHGKQFMREAAQKAGIDGGKLTILSENEAVSLICQHISEDTKFQMSRPGTKFMVINAKGRTVELTVHERQADGGLTQLQQPSECEWSGYQVDKELYKMIIKIVGGPLWSKFKDENTADYHELQRILETTKYRVTPESTGKITFKLPVQIKQMYEKERGESIDEAIERSNYTGKITWLSDKLRIQAKVFQELFNPCTDKLVAHIKTLLHDPEVKDTKILFMVGTFSDSAMLQSAVKRAFPVCEVKIPDKIPDGADMCVLQAAVSFGHRPVCIATRVSKYTYGINISPPFDSTIHKEDHRVPVGGIYRCRDVFKRYIQEGETLRVGEARSVKHAALKTNQKEMMLEIFASQNREPMYVDEKDCEYLGKIVVNLPGVDKILVEVKMIFGETELIVEAHEFTSHMQYRAYFDFL